MHRFLLLCSAFVSVVVVAPAGPAASALMNTAAGFAISTTPAGMRHMSFGATQLPDGSVVGAAHVRNPNTGFTYVLSLNCFIREGDSAIIGGIVTEANNADIVGWSFVFAVHDEPDVVTFTLTQGDAHLSCDNLLAETGEPSLASFLTDFAIPTVEHVAVTLRPIGD
jgi:hypothetical protein